MSLSQRQRPYFARTHINLPFIEDGRRAPGDLVEIQDLIDAKQTDEDVEALIANGALGEEDDGIHSDNIIPDPSIPTIQSVVAQAQSMVDALKAEGLEIPKDLKAVAELDYNHAVVSDKGASNDSTR
jgi:hypothetical protein